MTAATSQRQQERPYRQSLRVRGQIQGVGFRPHVYRCAEALGLSGWVRNTGDGVTIEVEGRRALEFESRLRAALPPLARIDSLESHRLAVTGERGFAIADSDVTPGDAAVPADVATCGDCVAELFDPQDRRYLHPFIACCNCGPRYSMTRRPPYDRHNTAMHAFPMCAVCDLEYRDPTSRRLHAEPIACNDCGPQLSHPPATIAAAVAAGSIVAIKGIGGYHLVCDARRADRVQLLRERKRRDARPFAVMLLNIQSAAAELSFNDRQRDLLEGPERPVVVLDRQPGSTLPDALAPGLSTLGAMLPYTPLHYLLFHNLLGQPQGRAWLGEAQLPALVMTSANRSGEPMLSDDARAAERLQGIADLIVTHSRVIEHSCDDSVLRATPASTALLRRGRGHAPNAIALPASVPPLLATGAHLKNTVCALRGDRAFMSAHLGDLDSAAMRELLARRAGELMDWLGITPAAIACDLHPDYASTHLAGQLSESLGIPLIPVQHHHAHIAAITAASGMDEPVIGLALDGHGMGSDGSAWGGELLRLEAGDFTRLGHFAPLRLPGGERAVGEPWRVAYAIADSLGHADDAPLPADHQDRRALLAQLLASPMTPESTSCGRYFDAAAAILGLCSEVDYEAQAAMQLESLCRVPRSDPGLFRLCKHGPDFSALFDRLFAIKTCAEGAELFHGVLLDALEAWVLREAQSSGLTTVALGGGCFLNGPLAALLPPRLRAHGLTVLCPWHELPPGDGGISLGQAWVAAQQLQAGLPADARAMRGVS